MKAAGQSTPGLSARRAHVEEPCVELALRELEHALDGNRANAVLLFCSSRYDLGRLGPAIRSTFSVPVAACTTAGQIGPRGFERGGITGISLTSPDLRMHPRLLSPLALCRSQAVSLAREHAVSVAKNPSLKSFALLLVDGVSLWEEYVASALYEALGNVTVIGGSAAAEPGGSAPAVYYDGRFLSGAAVVAMFETSSINFAAFSAQHFAPTERKLVVSLADPERRIIYEINGEPAARAYAKALGIDELELGAQHFACHPLLLKLGEQILPRAIRARASDGSLLLACAIEEGLVVSVADGGDPLGTLERSLKDVEQRVPQPEVLLVFDCVHRRTELETKGLDARAGEILAQHGAVGFSSYGEQLGPLHANHTLAGLALGSSGIEGTT